MDLNVLTHALSQQMPRVLRWSGAVAKRLRNYNVALSGKTSGSSQTDALTLADLSVQELIVAALRDGHPLFRKCRIEAEETTGDLERFAGEGEYALSIDPIDGTKCYRDRTGNSYAVMLHLRSEATVQWSLVFAPESGGNGTWVEVKDGRVICGPDDPSLPAEEILGAITPVNPATRPDSKKIYLIGFQSKDAERALDLSQVGLEGFTSDELPGSIFELLATGEFGGSLIHSPNVYDFPVSLHIARTLGGDALWVHNGQPVHFRETWLDDRANMLRLPGIVACAVNRDTLKSLCELARDWNPVRYA